MAMDPNISKAGMSRICVTSCSSFFIFSFFKHDFSRAPWIRCLLVSSTGGSPVSRRCPIGGLVDPKTPARGLSKKVPVHLEGGSGVETT